jgi:hypothetical protein
MAWSHRGHGAFPIRSATLTVRYADNASAIRGHGSRSATALDIEGHARPFKSASGGIEVPDEIVDLVISALAEDNGVPHSRLIA